MGAMYRLKAYFGMVPADEMEIDEDRYALAASRRASREGWDDARDDDRWERRPADRYDERAERYADDRHQNRHDDRYETARYDDGGYETGRWDDDRAADRSPDRSADRRSPRPLPPAVRSVPTASPPVRGALAMDTASVAATRPAEVPEQRERPTTGAAALARITTLQPRSYNEARTIGERYREGVPVIMNLTELDDAAAKRLVDFAAGLVFALRGGFDKVTNRVFLLTPADVEVSADDARKLVGRVGTDRPRTAGS
jgi:cell division inhibitor SepF